MLKNISKILFGTFAIVVLNVLVIAGPFSIIWLVNYLFPIFSIPYSFLSWLLVAILNIGIFSNLIARYKENEL